MAAALVSSVLGCGNDPATMEDAVRNASPEQWAKLKEKQMDHEKELIQLSLEAERIRLADVQSARQREIEVIKATGKIDVNLYILTWTIVVLFFGLCGLLMAVPIPAASGQVIFVLFGAIASAFGTVIQYFYGSSKSSGDKTSLMALQTSEASAKQK